MAYIDFTIERRAGAADVAAAGDDMASIVLVGSVC